jgi:K+-sensing histidine kinase KdpD
MQGTRQILQIYSVSPENTTNSDKTQDLLALLDKMCSSADLDNDILGFLSLITELFELKTCFLAFHGGDNLILKSNDLIELNKSQEQEILSAIDQGKKSQIRDLTILPIKILNQNLAGLGFTCLNPLSEIELEQLKIFCTILGTAIKQNQIFNDLKTNNEKLLLDDQQKTELISTISHELRTPMANIIGFAELLLNKDFDTHTSKSYLKEIYESSLRLANLIANFLDLSRLEVNGILQFASKEETELDWLAERAWQQLASLNKKHKLIIEKDPNLESIYVDSDALLRVFINLFSNAIKYSFDQEEIICTLNQLKDQIEVKIIDQGIGIEKENLENIFEKFFRVNCVQTKYINGTGLGLWITKEIIKAHGGMIWAEKNKTKGTRIIFTIPLRD